METLFSTIIVLFPITLIVHPPRIGEQLEFVDGSLRLLNNNNTDDTSSGSLEVYTYGVWMSVCGVGFTMEMATVACSQLGFIDALSYCTDSW